MTAAAGVSATNITTEAFSLNVVRHDGTVLEDELFMGKRVSRPRFRVLS